MKKNQRFNPNDYKCETSQSNFLSIGCKADKKHGELKNDCVFSGKFNFPVSALYNFIVSNKAIKRWCFVERRTEYFILFFDFDIDKYLPNKETVNILDFTNFLINNILKTLNHYFILDECENSYIYSDRDDKHNFHLYFPKIIINQHYALTIRKKVIEYIMLDNKFNLEKDTYEHIIDSAVYENAGLKLLFQIKPHETGYYKINIERSTYKKISTNKIDQLKLTSIRTNNKSANVDFALNEHDYPLIIADIEQNYTPVINITNTSKTTKNLKQNTKNDKLNESIDDVNNYKFRLDIPEDMMRDLFNNLNVKRYEVFSEWIKIMFLCINYGLYELGHEVSKKCPQKYDKDYIDQLYSNKKNTAHKNPITCGSLFFWSKQDNPERHKQIIKQHYEKGFFRQIIPIYADEFLNISYCKRYNEKFVKPLNWNKYRSFVIKSALGTNKSGECIKSITDITESEPIDRISCMASRVVLCSDLFNRFNSIIYGEKSNRPINLNMKFYKDCCEDKKELYKEPRLVQTPDSLRNMLDPENKLHKIDILLIDEVESLFEYICLSDTLKDDRKMIYDLLCEYIKSAKYILLIDGNLSPYVANFIYKLRGDINLKFIYNKAKTDINNYYFLSEEHGWACKLDDYLKNGKKVFIPTDCIKYSVEIYERITKSYPNLKVKLYNANSSDEDKLELGNVNEVWKKYDVIICSPLVLYGLNFSELHFDVIFANYKTVILPGSAYQQLKRIRHLKDNDVFIYLDDPKKYNNFHYPTTFDELKKYIIQNINNFKKNFGRLDTCYQGCMTLENTDFMNLFLHFTSLRHAANNDYIGEFAKRIDEWGGKIFVEKKKRTRNRQFEEEKKILINEIREKEIDELLQANNDVDTYEVVKRKLSKTKHEKNIIMVKYIRDTFGLNTLDKEFLTRLGRLSNIDKFKKALIYLANDNYIKQYIDKHKDGEFIHVIANLFKQVELIKNFIKLYWKDGLLSIDTIDVYSTKDNMSDDQKKFFNDNVKTLRYLFDSLKRKKDPKNQYQLIDWLNCILQDFFGGFICLQVSGRKEKQINNKRLYYYNVGISSEKYIELILNKDIRIIDRYYINIIKSNFTNTKCTYESLHNYSNIGDIINKKPNYLFN